MTMAKDDSPSWTLFLQTDTSARKIQQYKVKKQRNIECTQLKTVGGFLPNKPGGMLEQEKESFQRAGCRCLPLLCPQLRYNLEKLKRITA